MGVKSSGVKPRESSSISLVGQHPPFSNRTSHPTHRDENVRRSKNEQTISVLETCCNPNGVKALHISYRSNLNCHLMYPLLLVLMSKNLLEKFYPMQKTHRKQAKFPFYRTTEEGKRIVRLYREVEKALEMKA